MVTRGNLNGGLSNRFHGFQEGQRAAVEELCDRVSPEFDPSIGRIKDIATGGVLAASIAAAIIGLLTLGPPFFKWIQ